MWFPSAIAPWRSPVHGVVLALAARTDLSIPSRFIANQSTIKITSQQSRETLHLRQDPSPLHPITQLLVI